MNLSERRDHVQSAMGEVFTPHLQIWPKRFDRTAVAPWLEGQSFLRTVDGLKGRKKMGRRRKCADRRPPDLSDDQLGTSGSSPLSEPSSAASPGGAGGSVHAQHVRRGASAEKVAVAIRTIAPSDTVHPEHAHSVCRFSLSRSVPARSRSRVRARL